MTESKFERWLMQVRPAFLAVVLKKIFRVKRRIVVTPAGKMLIDPVSVLGTSLADKEGFESDMRATLDKFLPMQGTFLDIGANEGFFTLYASLRAEKVIAVEPQKRAVACVEQNIRLNEIRNVEIHQIALGKSDELRQFHLANDTNTGSSGFVRMVNYKVPSIEMQVTTLDLVMAKLNWPSIDLAKIDIEGAEYELLLGASETLRKGTIKRIAIELHPKQLEMQGYSADQVIKLLSDNNYHSLQGAPTLVYELGNAASKFN